MAVQQGRDQVVEAHYWMNNSLAEQITQFQATMMLAANMDLQASQGNARFELPMLATYLVNTDGVVSHAFVDTDYTKRCEPKNICGALKSKKGNNP